jgi:hypothetical protein
MKKVLFILGITLLYVSLNAQTPYYFYNHEGNKVYLSLDTEHVFLSLKEQKLPDDIMQRNIKTTELKSDECDNKQYNAEIGKRRFWTALSCNENLSDEQYLNLLSEIKRENKDVIVSPYFKMKDNDIIGLSNFFYVKLKDEKDTTLLIQMAKQTSGTNKCSTLK